MKIYRHREKLVSGSLTLKTIMLVIGVAVFLVLSGLVLNWVITKMKDPRGNRSLRPSQVLVEAVQPKKEIVQTDKGPVELYTKTFTVDDFVRNSFPYFTPPLALTNNPTVQLREILARAGVELEAPKSLFFNTASNQVMVRSDLVDIEIVQPVLSVLNVGGISILRGKTNIMFYPPAGDRISGKEQGKYVVKWFEFDLTKAAKVFKVEEEGFAESGTKVCAELFKRAGVEMNEPGKVTCLKDSGLLMVRANERDVNSISNVIQTFSSVPYQLTVETKLVEISTRPDQFTKELGIALTNAVSPFSNERNHFVRQTTAVLHEDQRKRLLQKLEQTAGTDVVTVPGLTTMSGREVCMRMGENVDITDKNGRTQIIETGLTMTCLQSVLENGHTIDVTTIVTVIPVPKDPDQPFISKLLAYHGPLENGQTRMLVGSPSENNKAEKFLIVLITPTLIDAAGNALGTSK